MGKVRGLGCARRPLLPDLGLAPGEQRLQADAARRLQRLCRQHLQYSKAFYIKMIRAIDTEYEHLEIEVA
jgi:hypothetical protein